MSTRAKREKHFEAGFFPHCVACRDEVRPGHFVSVDDNDAFTHFNCDHPYRLTLAREARVMLGEPQMALAIYQEGAR